jgi:hypothetical protein
MEFVMLLYVVFYKYLTPTELIIFNAHIIKIIIADDYLVFRKRRANVLTSPLLNRVKQLRFFHTNWKSQEA